MRRTFLFLVLALVFFSCEDVIGVDLPTSETRLVVDALIGFNSRNGDSITVGQVKLTLTAPFFNDRVPPAEGATVEIIDGQTGEVFPLSESDPGIFTMGFPELRFDRDYTLSIQYDGEVFTATERLTPSPVINDAIQGDGVHSDRAFNSVTSN